MEGAWSVCGAAWPQAPPMPNFTALAAAALVVAALSASSAAADTHVTAATYSTGVTHVCAHALLFDQQHDQGTRADALAVASDIRASTESRLARVARVPVPAALRDLDARWIDTQRQLAATYARLWVQIYDAIAAASTPAQIAELPARLERLVNAPDALKQKAGRLELMLRVPDCTGGG